MKKEERENKIKELQEEVWSEVKQYFVEPEEMLKYLEFLNKYNNGYSIRNRMLIHAQRNGAVAVGTYKFYERLGYKVKQGEKGIKIVRPIITKLIRRGKGYVSLDKATAEEKAEIKAGKKRVHEYMSYMLMTVFDVLQTDMPKEEYPKIFPNAHKEYEVTKGIKDGIMERLAEVAKKIDVGYKKESVEEWNGGTSHGYYSLYSREIVLNPSNTETENITVGIHELAHAILHGGANKIQKELKIKEEDMSDQERELQAEMTAYLVAKILGIDTKETTVMYLASWTKKGQAIDEEKLEKLFTEIIKVSEYIIERLEK